jgi:hypothetical protein
MNGQHLVTKWTGRQDFGKPNVSAAKPQHRLWSPSLESMWTKTSSVGWHFLLRLGMADSGASPVLHG